MDVVNTVIVSVLSSVHLVVILAFDRCQHVKAETVCY